MKRTLLLGILLISALRLLCQPNMQRDSSIAVKVAGNTLKFPWAGGLNFTNWGQIDLNADGFKDLVVYDKSGAKIRTFINDKITGQPSYTHNSWYEDKFSFVNSWFATYDYNCDGLMDVFTYNYPGSGGGIRVFRNAGNLQFVQMGDHLQSDYGSSGGGVLAIPDNGVGVPGLVDVDHDGDLDIIVFDVMAYNIEYHQNQSDSIYHNCDSLIFKRVDKCWGKFNEGLCQVQLDVCPYPIAPHGDVNTNATEKIEHAGSGLMCFDADGDGLIDLLEGDLSCDSVFYFNNKGVVNNAHMTSFTSHYPPSKPVAMSIFPSTYFLDVDNDTKRDLIAATNWKATENLNNQWLYLNAGADNAPNFIYQKNNFLQESMIDLGEGAFPTLFDYEGDGDLDLLVGNYGYYTLSGDTSAVAFFKNIGNATTPSYSLITTNFAGLSTLSTRNMAPTTGDLDGDGDADLLIGVENGQLYYFKNTGGVGNPAVFSSTSTANYSTGFLSGIRAGTNHSYPQLIDLDKDGLLDIISGAGSGKIFYFRNIGTSTAPTFTLITGFLGNINVTQSTVCGNSGESMPFVFNYNGGYRMLIGNQCGNLFLYDVPAVLTNTFTLINPAAFNIHDGAHLAPVLFDVNGDTRLDLMLGNYSGGLTFYKGLSTSYNDVAEIKSLVGVAIYPNPATETVTIEFKSQNSTYKKIQLLDLSGRIVKEVNTCEDQLALPVSVYANGIYFVNAQVFDAGNLLQQTSMQKIVVAHE